MSVKIVMLSGQPISSTLMFHGLSETYEIETVIQETPVSMKTIMKRRAKKIGYFNAAGQIAFGLLVLPIVKKFSKNRKAEIFQKFNLNNSEIPAEKITKVSSVNSEESILALKRINPDIVVVNGSRIVSQKVLSSIDAVFINTHEGITPRYRGIHGGYWALAKNDKEHCGVTVHLVDKGVDTGAILYQSLISPERSDNFTTYTFHQTAAGIILMKKAINDVINNQIVPQKNDLDSNIWYHPTIWQYLYNYLVKGVK